MSISEAKIVKKFIGEIVSHKSLKTAIVKVTTTKVHAKYHKRMKSVKKYVAHDENDEFKVGDRVEFVSSRPYSATKRFKILKKV